MDVSEVGVDPRADGVSRARERHAHRAARGCVLLVLIACSGPSDKRTIPPDDPYCSENALRDFALLLGSAEITYDIDRVDDKTGKRYAEIQIRDRERLGTEAVKSSAFLVVDVSPLDKGFLVRATCK